MRVHLNSVNPVIALWVYRVSVSLSRAHYRIAAISHRRSDRAHHIRVLQERPADYAQHHRWRTAGIEKTDECNCVAHTRNKETP